MEALFAPSQEARYSDSLDLTRLTIPQGLEEHRLRPKVRQFMGNQLSQPHVTLQLRLGAQPQLNLSQHLVEGLLRKLLERLQCVIHEGA